MTTQATHTPGPWEISKNEAGELDICEAGAGNMLADLAKCKNAVANARLIAAAPDLLEACKEWVKHLDSLPNDTEKCRHLKMALNNRAGDLMLAAIAKAEGRANQ